MGERKSNVRVFTDHWHGRASLTVCGLEVSENDRVTWLVVGRTGPKDLTPGSELKAISTHKPVCAKTVGKTSTIPA